jgi:acylglycerol lipase
MFVHWTGGLRSIKARQMRLAVAGLILTTACAGGYGVRQPRPRVPVAAGVKHVEEDFEGFKLVRMFEQSWRPANEQVRASLIIVHGFKDHGTRYNELANRLAQRGFAVHAFDLRGFGSSGGRRVYVESFDEYIEDLTSYVDITRARESGKPVFLLGHGLGGTIALEYVLQKSPQLAGLIVSGTPLRSTLSGFKRAMTRAAGTVLPLLAILSVDVEKVSQDREVVRACKEDPLIAQGNGPARTARELLSAMSHIGEQERELRTPLLILHGAADAISSPDGSRDLFERASSKDKTLHVYEGMFHDLWREPAREQVMGDLFAWLESHLR